MAGEGFIVTPKIAMVFFRTCSLYKIVTEKDRLDVMRKLVARHKAKYVPHPEEFLKDKRLLRIRRKEDLNDL